jgi:hypothetical protein
MTLPLAFLIGLRRAAHHTQGPLLGKQGTCVNIPIFALALHSIHEMAGLEKPTQRVVAALESLARGL